MCRALRVAVLALLTGGTLPVCAQDVAVSKAAVALPADLAPPVASALAPDAVTVTTAGAKLEFWWVRAVTLTAAPATAPSWADVPAGALVGAFRTSTAITDIRGFTIRPGAYTLRFALQPPNGDHLGISPNREFLLLGPAADDLTAGPAGYDGAVALAKKASHRAHPAAFSIDPPMASAAPLSTATNDIGLRSVIVSVATSANGALTPPLTFGLVVEGTIEH